jgi:hypothetical protein
MALALIYNPSLMHSEHFAVEALIFNFNVATKGEKNDNDQENNPVYP